MASATAQLDVPGIGPVPVSYSESGTGQPVLLLHGGAGPFSVSGFATLMSAAGYRVIVPVHPGFDGMHRHYRNCPASPGSRPSTQHCSASLT
jgi:pimeloyl-ACP methyl ester carboxylesterase